VICEVCGTCGKVELLILCWCGVFLWLMLWGKTGCVGGLLSCDERYLREGWRCRWYESAGVIRCKQ